MSFGVKLFRMQQHMLEIGARDDRPMVLSEYHGLSSSLIEVLRNLGAQSLSSSCRVLQA